MILENVRFDGSDYNPANDNARLTKQIGRVYSCMVDGNWKTLNEISLTTSDPQASISAQLRHLRKDRFGGYIVEKRLRDDSSGFYEYKMQTKH